jgi:FtsH-binding integral membrane protein
MKHMGCNEHIIAAIELYLNVIKAHTYMHTYTHTHTQIMKHMGCDEHIIAAIELYLDVINLFMMFMLLFSGGRD